MVRHLFDLQGNLGDGNMILKGDKALARKFARMKVATGNRAASAGIRAQLTPFTRALRAAVNASDASASMKRVARKAIGRRSRKEKGQYTAKVGFGVGKRKQAKPRTKKGVGISSANIHWPVLGTKERTTKSGHPTGKMPAILEGLTKEAFSSARPAMLRAAQQAMSNVVNRDAKRK